MIGNTYFRELLQNRAPSPVLINSTPIADLEHCSVSFKLIYVTAPCEFVGYHLASENLTSTPEEDLPYLLTRARFWAMTANTDNFLPDRLVPHSDTAGILGGDNFEVNISYASPSWFDPFPLTGDYTFDCMLPNPVRLDVPGMYWIGSSFTSYGAYGGGNFRASTVVAAQRGLNDLRFKGATPDNEDGVCWEEWEIPERLTNEGVEITTDPNLWPFIDIWLICQPLTPGVPYGPG